MRFINLLLAAALLAQTAVIERREAHDWPTRITCESLLKTKFAGHNPTADVVDWNGDGKLDVIVGAEDGFFYYFDGNFIKETRNAN